MPAVIENPTSPLTATETDLSLLGRFIDTGDPAAFAAIVTRYGNLVFAASMRILGDQGGAQDVSQETFYRLMKEPRSVQRSLAGWLHRSATHLALDVRRSEVARRKRERTYGQERPESRVVDSTWAEVSPLVDAALDELEDEDQMLIVRHFLQGTQQADLAAELHLSAATISRRIKAALAQLHEKLQSRGVRLGLAALAVLLVEGTARPASAAVVAEMAKMHLVASLRSPAAVAPPARLPSPFKSVNLANPAAPVVNLTAVYWACFGLFAMLTAIVILFWVRVSPAPPPAPAASPPPAIHDDR
jgi:RNA polymerase sigma-70 factor (ECF subfamily)